MKIFWHIFVLATVLATFFKKLGEFFRIVWSPWSLAKLFQLSLIFLCKAREPTLEKST